MEKVAIDINDFFNLFDKNNRPDREAMYSILKGMRDDKESPLVGKFASFSNGTPGIIAEISPVDNRVRVVTQRLRKEDAYDLWEMRPVYDIVHVEEITDIDKKLFLSITPVKDILNREFLKFKLPKEGQEVNMRIHFRENEDVESDTDSVDVKVYKLHGAFCVSLEHDGHEIIGEVFESGQRAISEIYKEMEEIIEEWGLKECIANSVEDATYGWIY